ncbi:hypothetical protein [Vagococcus salmoninarum]|uniref:hypothetical protein n=1 Tax=Vagococcus salmoninarum TaxID=2739 RepID=UPI003F9BA83D
MTKKTFLMPLILSLVLSIGLFFFLTRQNQNTLSITIDHPQQKELKLYRVTSNSKDLLYANLFIQTGQETLNELPEQGEYQLVLEIDGKDYLILSYADGSTAALTINLEFKKGTDHETYELTVTVNHPIYQETTNFSLML